MKNEYGFNRETTIAVRVSEAERDQIKAAAARAGVSVSHYIRLAIAQYEKTKGD